MSFVPNRALESASSTNATNPAEVEHVAARVRARRFALAATLAWTFSLYLDFVASRTLAPGELGPLVLLRLGGTLIALGAWAAITRVHTMSPRTLRVLLVLTFFTMNVLLGVMGAISGGITSPYFGGAIVVLAAYGVVAHARWNEGAIAGGAIGLAYPLTLLIAGLISPRIASQLADEHARTIFTFDSNNIMTMSVIAILGGHVAWALRRQVFEARSLGRYKLKTALGAGGMGEVWIAYHHGLKRDVAVKILRTDHTRDSHSAMLRFEREVRATTELSHPNTVRVLDYGVTDDGLWYYVMELLSGENLAELVAREGAQPAARALHFTIQAARALAEAHAKGIVHRDVKPENLLVTSAGGENDFVKVVDFGIAKVSTEENPDEKALTRTGSILGSPLWLSPEVCAGKAAVPASDVYALGAVLSYLLTARAPFERDTVAALVLAHIHDAPATLPAHVPADIAAIVSRCLQKDPADRFTTAGDLARALAACSDAGKWVPRETVATYAEGNRAKVGAFDATQLEKTHPES